MKEWLMKISYLFFPKRCEICGEVICLDETKCEKCLSLHKITGETCRKCGKELLYCTCSSTKAEYRAFCAVYYYKDNIVTTLHRLKDYGYRELADNMGREISECVKERFGSVQFDVVTYVPMTRKKQSKRGYNQSKLLADSVAKEMKIPRQTLLRKVRNTAPQRGSSAQKRRVNLHGAFDLRSGAQVKGKTVLLVDDVRTTGSTLNECALVLKGYGAKAVYATAYATTVRK